MSTLKVDSIQDTAGVDNQGKIIQVVNSTAAVARHQSTSTVFIDTGFRNANFPNSDKWAPCITAQPNMWCVPMERKASVKEYFELQGFNTEDKNITLSDHRMKILIGNSMTVNVIEEILKKGFKSLNIL